ncbi:hypothetical protein [Pseudomonas sp. LB3P31]
MRMKRLAAIASLVFLAFPASAECVFSELPQEERPYKLNLSGSECKLVRYSGGSVVTIFVNYPSMEVVRERPFDDSLVSIRLVYISKSTFNQNATIEGRQPASIKNGIETYGDGNSRFIRFIGGDGNPTFVSEWPNTYDARHLFNYGIQIRYQYALKHENFRGMDDFAITFLKKITRE